METNNTPPNILDQLKEYFETRYKLLKYEAVESGASAFSTIITDLVMVIVFTIAMMGFSAALAFWLSEITGSYWKGFGITAFIYFFISTLVKFFKISIERVLINVFIRKILSKKNEEEQV
jgi:hypothetical protein